MVSNNQGNDVGLEQPHLRMILQQETDLFKNVRSLVVYMECMPDNLELASLVKPEQWNLVRSRMLQLEGQGLR